MLFQNTILAGVVSLASLASAGIVSFTIPKTIVPGAKFTATLTENNATKSNDISIAFGIASGPYVEPFGLGTDLLGKSILTNTDITPSPETVDVELTLPEYYGKGEAVVVASINSVLGARLTPIVFLYNATVTVGDEASTETVKSGEVLTIQHQY
ncbi:putative secreted protein nis1 [Neofusicoccum parvum]|uniref:Putative secreted protein nis1 protein n=1 Tax=Botryosphaeria parva (strain UCR-NP2) TaxID=1287680 RepID=R1GIC8_BOTPV|nr:putative secreted protein nis1 protein [Neofusicoccum parvum UCRNP2]GME56065.1 putative secreted protein nis1 [Neofusicoccum parvum]